MFRLFRKNREALKKYLLAGLLGIMSVGMVFVVTPFFSGNDTSRVEMGVLAEVAGQRITTPELQREIQTRFRSADSAIVPALAPSILDEMVLRVGLSIQARKMGLEVSDRELLQAIQAFPWLNSNGAFIGLERYQNLIQQQTGRPVAQFEAELRDSLLQEKIRAVVTDSVRVSPEEVRQEFLRRDARARIEYVVFDPAQLLKAVPVTPEKLEAFFQKDAQRYKASEQRRVRYALIDADSVRAQVRVGDEELRRYYTQRLADYRVPERVKVSHILFKTTDKTAAEVATIEKTARDVLGQIKSGKDFAELAKKSSEDTSASNGGDLGWIVRGQTVKEFEAAAFSLKPGQTSDLIKTIYGIHILKVFEKQDAHLQSLDEVKETLRAALEKERVEAAEGSLASRIESELKSNAPGFDAVVKKAGLEVKETPLFDYKQKVPDFGDSEGFSDLAFQLGRGQAGQPLNVPKGVAIIQVAEIVPEHLPKLKEVRPRVEEDYRAEQSKALAAEKAQDFAAKAKTGDFKKTAQAAGLKVKESKDFTQQENVEDLIPGSRVAAAFTLAPGQTSGVVSLGTNSVVFRVLAHTPPDETLLAARQDSINEELLERKRSLAFEIFRKNLKSELLKTGQLKMNDAALKQFLATYRTRPPE